MWHIPQAATTVFFNCNDDDTSPLNGHRPVSDDDQGPEGPSKGACVEPKEITVLFGIHISATVNQNNYQSSSYIYVAIHNNASRLDLLRSRESSTSSPGAG